MVRIFFSLLVLSLAGGFMGCYHTSGICDCDRDESPCAHRAPWAVNAPVAESPIAPNPGSMPAPLPTK